ncbi:hypothetical protein Tco_0362572, partial [Tanacetum coccineum]
TTIAGQRWILGRGLRLMVMKYLQSLEYLAALRGAIGRAIDKGMQDGLAVGIDHGKAKSGLVDVAAYVPSMEANYVSALNPFYPQDHIWGGNLGDFVREPYNLVDPVTYCGASCL